MFLALTFVPVTDVIQAFEELEQYVDGSLEPIIDYFEDNYVGRRQRRGRKRPRFPITWWNVHDRTLADDPRTNNNAEAGFRRLQSDFGCQHPTIWEFLSALRKHHVLRDVDYNKLEQGRQPPAKQPKAVLREERIRSIVENYEDRTIIELLRAIAHNIQVSH